MQLPTSIIVLFLVFLVVLGIVIALSLGQKNIISDMLAYIKGFFAAIFR